MSSPLRAELRSRLTAAMRARDRPATSAMRDVLAALENAEAVPSPGQAAQPSTSEHVAGAAVGLGAGEVPRRLLSPEDERAVVEREVAELRASAATLAEAGQHERSAELLRIADTVDDVLHG